jgi:hypothetical protein
LLSVPNLKSAGPEARWQGAGTVEEEARKCHALACSFLRCHVWSAAVDLGRLLLVAGEGDEPSVREEAEAVWHRRRAPAQEGPAPVREVAQGRAHPAPAPRPQTAPQGAAGAQPVHTHPRQEPGYVRQRSLSSSMG